MEMKNREQRRREKFGKAGKVHQHDQTTPWPESEANPALRTGTSDQAADASTDDTDTAPTPAKPAKPKAKPANKPVAKP